jgi:tetratricopeptide (TPR) repeat protein
MARLHDDVLFQQARKAYLANHLVEARNLFEQLLQRDRNNVRAIVMLGQIAFVEHRFEDAAAHAQRAVSIAPGDDTSLLLLAGIRTFQGRYDEAQTCCDKVLRRNPEHPEAIASKADAYERAGQRDKARAVLRPFVKDGRETTRQASIQAQLDIHDRDYDAVIELVTSHLSRKPSRGKKGPQLHFLLGKALERSQRYDDAFAAYAQANAATPTQFNADRWRQAIDGLIESFTPKRFADVPRASHGEQLPVFVLGMPRCGSTLVETILDAHPDAVGIGEIQAMEEIIGTMSLAIGSNLPYPTCIEDLEQSDVDTLAGTYLERLRAIDGRASRLIDKYLGNYLHVGMLPILFPEARIIHCCRHPLDTCFSCFRTPLFAAHGYATDLRNLGIVHVEYERIMRHWRDELQIPMLEVHYEALVGDQETLTRRIIDYCGLDWNDQCLRFYESGRSVLTASYDQVNQPIYASSVGQYRNFEKHLGPLITALAEGGWTEEALKRAATAGRSDPTI